MARPGIPGWPLKVESLFAMEDIAEAVLDRNTFPNNDPAPDPELASYQASARTIAFMRRRLLDRRVALEEHWRGLFPRHDFATLRLIRRPLAWDDAAWARAARAYHQDRKRGFR
jgi:hypothetical protein